MQKLKILLISSLLFFLSAECFSQEANTRLLVAIDGYAPALKVGLKKDLSARFSIQGSAGLCVFAPDLLSWNVFGTYRITNPAKPLGLFLEAGLLDNYIVTSLPMYSLGAGGGAGIIYKFRNNSTLTFRLGVITGPSLDEGVYEILTLPNYGIEYAFPIGKKKKHALD